MFAQGVNYFHGKIEQPRLRFWALQIDLASPNVSIVVKGGGANTVSTEDAGTANSGRTYSTKVSSFVKENSLIAGINAAPFDIASSKEGQLIQNVGLVISDGVLISPANSSYDAIVFYRDGTVAIVGQSELKDTSYTGIKNAVGGFHQILTNGEAAERTLNREERHPRSAIGISSDGRYLYLLVIDGRQLSSIGSTEKETALLLRALGSWNGLNLDGGGSTALALRYKDGKVRVANSPIHNGIPRQERAVAGSLGIHLKPR
jgi:exopolysaccharide biosynthesis protein